MEPATRLDPLRRTLHEFLSYYHAERTHQGLANDCPESRPVATTHNVAG